MSSLAFEVPVTVADPEPVTHNISFMQSEQAAVPAYIYSVTTARDPSALPRILEMFALRDLIPEEVRCHSGEDDMTIMVKVCGLEPQMADHLVHRFNSFPVVQTASLTCSGRLRPEI